MGAWAADIEMDGDLDIILGKSGEHVREFLVGESVERNAAQPVSERDAEMIEQKIVRLVEQIGDRSVLDAFGNRI